MNVPRFFFFLNVTVNAYITIYINVDGSCVLFFRLWWPNTLSHPQIAFSWKSERNVYISTRVNQTPFFCSASFTSLFSLSLSLLFCCITTSLTVRLLFPHLFQCLCLSAVCRFQYCMVIKWVLPLVWPKVFMGLKVLKPYCFCTDIIMA